MKNGIKSLATWLIIGIILVVVISSIIDNSNSKMTYSELIENIEEKNVESIEVNSEGTSANVALKSEKGTKQVNIPSLDSFMNYSNEYIKAGNFTLESASKSIWVTLLSLLMPFGLIIIFLIFWFFMMNGAGGQGGGNKTLTFGKSRARLVNTADKNIMRACRDRKMHSHN